MSSRAFTWLLPASCSWLIACSGTSSGNPSDGAGGGDVVTPRGALLAKSDLPRDENPELSEGDAQAFGSSNRQFALELYADLDRATPDENLFFSPWSIGVALAMTYAGAEGDTETEMRSTLHFDLDEPALHEAFNATDRALAGRKDELFDDSTGQG